MFQLSPGASWDFGDSPLISRRRCRLGSFFNPPPRSSSESQLPQDSSFSLRPAKSLPSSPALRRCVWAETPDSHWNGRQSPPPRLEYLDEPQHAALESSKPPPRSRSRQTSGVSSANGVPSRPTDVRRRRPLEVYMHRSCTRELVMVVVEVGSARQPLFITIYRGGVQPVCPSLHWANISPSEKFYFHFY